MTGRYFGDWGTTRLRIWHVVDGAIVASVEGPGVGRLDAPAQDVLRATLARLPGGDADIQRVTLCGMAGARNGLREVAYAAAPLSVAAWRERAGEFRIDGVDVHIGAGVAMSGPAGRRDVMRGEETQVFGAIALMPELGTGRHILILPGTHCKWVSLLDGRVMAIRTYITGELFALLGASSLFALGSDGSKDDLDRGFASGLEAARAGLLGQLFSARVGQLLEGHSAQWAGGYASGLLIGSEFSEQARLEEPPAKAVLVGDGVHLGRYHAACTAFGIVSHSIDVTDATLQGLMLLDAKPE